MHFSYVDASPKASSLAAPGSHNLSLIPIQITENSSSEIPASIAREIKYIKYHITTGTLQERLDFLEDYLDDFVDYKRMQLVDLRSLNLDNFISTLSPQNAAQFEHIYQPSQQDREVHQQLSELADNLQLLSSAAMQKLQELLKSQITRAVEN